jgi:hypothetical protein
MEASIPSPLPQALDIKGRSVQASQEKIGHERLIYPQRKLPVLRGTLDQIFCFLVDPHRPCRVHVRDRGRTQLDNTTHHVRPAIIDGKFARCYKSWLVERRVVLENVGPLSSA